MQLKNIVPEPASKVPLKRSKTGLEAEFHILDNKGKVSCTAPEVIAKLLEKHKKIDVTKEIGRNMIEFGCYPDVHEYNPTLHMLETVNKAVDVCKDMDLKLYPFATYPGKFEPLLSKGKGYALKKKIFGYPRVMDACRVTGFHHHYTLPKGVFDSKKKILKLMHRSKLERSMVASYNLEIAADPALTLFAQSSPFFQGSHFAKDSRLIIYRGGRKLKYMDGVYAKMQQIGALPPYKQTVTDLLSSIGRRINRWKEEIKKADPTIIFEELYPYNLEIGWHPVKINKHGTLEQRGMDINLLSNVVAISVMLKFCLRKLQREFIEVIPADFAMDEPFKLENGILYIPPHTYVRNKLQLWSAYPGYSSPEVRNYAKSFFKFARSVTPKSYNSIIQPLKDMVDNGESASDRIMKYAKRKGYVTDNKINNSDAAELALHYAEDFPKDLEETKKKLERVANL